jgi:dipeptidyl aminopeptidase/acylaminoacyl peptidase
VAAAPSNDEFAIPRFSPDGRRIAFQRLDAHEWVWNIWIMNADGGAQTRLIFAGGSWPSWVPDGKRIAFASQRRTGNTEIYVKEVENSEPNCCHIWGGRESIKTIKSSARLLLDDLLSRMNNAIAKRCGADLPHCRRWFVGLSLSDAGRNRRKSNRSPGWIRQVGSHSLSGKELDGR